jgi:MFS family permease
MTLFERGEWKLLWPFYVSAFLMGAFMIIAPIWIIYLNKTFSFTEISIALAISSFTPIIFEVPTGAVADLFGRKLSTIISMILMGFFALALPFTKVPWMLYALFVFFGVAQTFSSGASDAWVVDYLHHKKKKKWVQSYFTKFWSLASAGFIIGPLVASILATFLSLDYVFYIQGILWFGLALFMTVFCKEYFKKSKVKFNEIFSKTYKNSKDAIKFTFKNKTIMLMTLATMFFAIILASEDLALQPFLVSLGLSVEHLGYVFSIIGAVGVFAPLLGKKLSGKFSHPKRFFVFNKFILLILRILIIVAVFPFYILGTALIVLFHGIRDVEFPVITSYYHKFLPSKLRATIGSTSNMLRSIVSAVSFIVIGVVLDTVGPRYTLVIFGLFCIPAMICYALIKEKHS